MTVKQQMVLAMFSQQTIKTAKEMFSTKEKRRPVDAFDISFRLYMVDDSAINFEFCLQTPLGFYFKPVGYFKNDLTPYLLYEFEEPFKHLTDINNIDAKTIPKSLTTRENAVIAAFSIEAILEVFKIFDEISIKGYEPELKDGVMIPPNLRYDRNIIINGLKSELIMAFEGYPQFFVDDEYNINGPIGAYQMHNGKLQVNPIVDFSTDYNNLYKRSLLSSYKSLKAEIK